MAWTRVTDKNSFEKTKINWKTVGASPVANGHEEITNKDASSAEICGLTEAVEYKFTIFTLAGDQSKEGNNVKAKTGN